MYILHSYNALSSLTEEIVNLKSLKNLFISQNQLSNLPDLGKLVKLEKLSLSKNMLTTQAIDAIHLDRCNNLKEFWCCGNYLEEWPAALFALTK